MKATPLVLSLLLLTTAIAPVSAIRICLHAVDTDVLRCGGAGCDEPVVAVGENHYVMGDAGAAYVSVWIYEETNTIPDLQRGDDVCTHVDVAMGTIDSDTIWF